MSFPPTQVWLWHQQVHRLPMSTRVSQQLLERRHVLQAETFTFKTPRPRSPELSRDHFISRDYFITHDQCSFTDVRIPLCVPLRLHWWQMPDQETSFLRLAQRHQRQQEVLGECINLWNTHLTSLLVTIDISWMTWLLTIMFDYVPRVGCSYIIVEEVKTPTTKSRRQFYPDNHRSFIGRVK